MSRFFTRRMLGIHLLGFLSVIACLALASWQWDRAHVVTKADTETTTKSFDELSPLKDFLPLASVGVTTSVSGTWQPNERIVLDGRIPDGPAMLNPTPDQSVYEEFVGPIGAWIVDVLELADGSSLGVVRGFTTDPESFPLAQGATTLQGVMQPSEDAPTVHLVNDLQLLTTQMITDKARTIAHDGYFVTSQGDAGLETVVPLLGQQTNTKLHVRNVIYTVNWLVFALIVMAMWQRVVRDELESGDLAKNTRD